MYGCRCSPREPASRHGAATLDYVLALGVVLSLAALIIPLSKFAITVVYDFICTLVAWPFV